MFDSNLGDLDRIARILLGTSLLIGYTSIPPAPFSWLLLVGLLPVVSGFLGTCPIYSTLNISTNKLD